MKNGKKEKVTIVITLILIEILSIFLMYKTGNNKYEKEEIKKTNSMYAIMIEEGKDTKKYIEYKEAKWPGVGYIYNKELSRCVDNKGKEIEGIMTFENETKVATVKAKEEVYCYLYFDYDPEPEAFEFNIEKVKVENNKNYTKSETNKVNLKWEEEDIKYYCLTEEETKEKCEWVRTNGVQSIRVDYTFKDETNGEKRVYAYIKDEGGSTSPREEDTIILDNKGPETTLEATKTRGEGEWYKEVKIEIRATDKDNGIGVSSIKYCITTKEDCEPDTILTNTPIELETNLSEQKVCAEAEDKLGNVGQKECTSERYKVDKTSPGVSFSIGSSNVGENGWYKAISIKVTGSDTNGSGIESIKYCKTTGNTCTPTEEIANNTNIALDNSETSKVCAEIKDAAGNTSETKCSEVYKVDGESPRCGAINKTVTGTVNGVSGTVGCSDTNSGCSASSFSNLKSTTNIVIKDTAGNSNTCSVPITSQIQQRSTSCKTYKSCQTAECGYASCPSVSRCGCLYYSSWKYTSGVTITSSSYPGYQYEYSKRSCSSIGKNKWHCDNQTRSCTQAKSCQDSSCGYNLCSNSVCGCSEWNNSGAWSNVTTCTPSTTNTSKTECQTLYS